jgi:AraC-like DNA-binding protein
MDPLSDVLSLLRINRYYSAQLRASGRWGLQFPAQEGIKFTAVVRGSHWLTVDGAAPIELHEGDCFLLTRGQPFAVSSDPSIAPADPAAFSRSTTRDELEWYCGGDDVLLVGGRFFFDGDPAEALIGALPPIVQVRHCAPQASVLRWALERFVSELHDHQPGRSRVAEHLAHLMLVEVLRIQLKTASEHGTGWFVALSDRHLGKAVRAMHARPAHRWSVDELARTAAMSRSVFATRFKAVLEIAPMAYLARWRMLVAADRLLTTRDPVASIAASLGYESEGAFSTAFKRVMGASPSQYRQRARAGPPALDRRIDA